MRYKAKYIYFVKMSSHLLGVGGAKMKREIETEAEEEIIIKDGRCYALDPVMKRRILGKGTLLDQIEEDLLRSELPT